MPFWLQVFDLSDRADTPARQKATVQVFLVFGVVGLLAAVGLVVFQGWYSRAFPAALLTALLGLTNAGTAQWRRRRTTRRRI